MDETMELQEQMEFVELPAEIVESEYERESSSQSGAIKIVAGAVGVIGLAAAGIYAWRKRKKFKKEETECQEVGEEHEILEDCDDKVSEKGSK